MKPLLLTKDLNTILNAEIFNMKSEKLMKQKKILNAAKPVFMRVRCL